MDFLKNKKFKSLFVFAVAAIFALIFQVNVLAVTNPYVEITGVSVNEDIQSLRFTVCNTLSTEPSEYGVIFSRSNEEIKLDTEGVFVYSFTENSGKNYAVNIKIPDYAVYQNIYAVAYVETEGVVYYSNKVYSSYAKLANFDKVVMNEVSYEDNDLSFNMATTVDKNAEYGLIFSKNQELINLSLDVAANDSANTIVVKVNNVDEKNEFNVTIGGVPAFMLDTTFKACAYVKNLETLETYYTETKEFNLFDLYYEELINNVDISYNAEKDGIRFATSTICDLNTTLGIVLVNKYSETITVDTPNAYIDEVTGKDVFAINLTGIPASQYDKEVYAVAYLKFLNENGVYEYYYSNVYSASYNDVKAAE